MKQIYLYSVPHTGTNFLNDILTKNGYSPKKIRHFTDVIKEDYSKSVIIAPIRNPKDVYITWKGRDRKRTYNWNDCWKAFNQFYLMELDNFFIIPVDTELGQKELSKLNQFLGSKLKTDWKPVSSKPEKRISFEKEDLSEILELPVVKKYYSFEDPFVSWEL